jgi:hypothetical protein
MKGCGDIMPSGNLMSILPIMVITSWIFLPFSNMAVNETPASASFSIAPINYTPPNASISYFVFNISPGKTFQSQVAVTNTGKAKGTAIISVVDGLTSPTTGTTFADRSIQSQDVGAWLSLDISEVTLNPGERRIVHFQGTIPETTWIGQHVGGIAVEGTEDSPDPNSKGNFQIKLHNRMVIAIQIDMPGASVEKLEFLKADFGGAYNNQKIMLDFQNTGEMMIKPQGNITISDSSGKALKNESIKMDTVLPHTSFTYPLNLSGDALPPGNYKVTANLTYGKTEQKLQTTKTASISEQKIVETFGKQGEQYLRGEYTPTWLKIVVGVLIALLIISVFAMIFLQRRTRQKFASLASRQLESFEDVTHPIQEQEQQTPKKPRSKKAG